jgi:hypothetical protein
MTRTLVPQGIATHSSLRRDTLFSGDRRVTCSYTTQPCSLTTSIAETWVERTSSMPSHSEPSRETTAANEEIDWN